MKHLLLILIISLLFIHCAQTTHKAAKMPTESGVLNLRTQFYDSNGNSSLSIPMKIWYIDSVVVEEVVGVKWVTVSGKTTLSYPLEVYRYIDLPNKRWYNYKTFSDTSRIIKSGVLPDSLLPGSGWTFYINSLPMKGAPEVLPDTTIKSIRYKRIKFSNLKGKSDSYTIGYLRCDNKGKLFSLEKIYSGKVNCSMTLNEEFKVGASKPFATTELEFLADTLSQNELKIFHAWKENAKKVNAY